MNPRQPDNARRGHALVIGGSMAGLLAARVLSEHFARVTLLERDPPPVEPGPRKGVPQGRHVHLLLTTGSEIIGQLFPGLWDEIRAQGSLCVDLAADVAWFHYGAWKSREPSGIPVYCQSRPLLEWNVRRRVVALDAVEVRTEVSVQGLSYDPARSRVAGVTLASRGGGEPETLVADLVVDATGRGTRTPRWLAELGYPRPREDAVPTDIHYASRLVRLPAGRRPDWACLLIFPRAPHQTRVGYVFAREGDIHHLTLAGFCGDAPPTDEDGFRAFARSLPRPELWDTIRDAEPLTPIAQHRLPSNLWRRYDLMPRFPDGLAVVGDAVCSFNPVFGQGITMAALDARALADHLSGDIDAGRTDGRPGCSLRFQQRLVAAKSAAWTLVTTEDYRYPQVAGERPLGLPALNWYKSRMLEAAADPRLNRSFLQVMTFQRRLQTLFDPRVVARVLFHTAARSLRAAVRPARGATSTGS